jgi:undecaprenyl-diphosphatase
VTPFHAVLLGILQGLTEFLPVSSTAHLTLAGKLFGFINPAHPEAWTEFIAVMQLGTLTAVLLYFRGEIRGMVTGLTADVKLHGPAFRSYGPESRMAWLMVLGTLPVALLGFYLKHLIEGMLTKMTIVIVGSLVLLAVLLWIAEKVALRARGLNAVTWRDALIVGCAQALALIPGASRSGTTITAGLFLGLDRPAAARFSFLLSIPAVLASGLFELLRIRSTVFELGAGNLFIATVVSGFAGYAAIAWLLRFLMRNSLMSFVWYRIGLGFLISFALFHGWITP